MRIFTQSRGQLGGYSLPMKIALSFFVIFILLGLATSIALYHQQFSFEADQAAKYYRGNEEELDAEIMHVEKSYRQMLETAHFHLYIMPVVYLAFVHLYFLTTRNQTEKSALTLLLFSSLLLEILAPWLVRYGSPSFSPLFLISGLGLTVTTIWMSAVCLFELWIPARLEKAEV